MIVHDSPSWHEIRDRIQNPEEIVILEPQKAEYYKQATWDFFAPITEGYQTCQSNGGPLNLTSNLLSDMRCALSHILIAYDYKARILEEDFFDYDNPLTGMIKAGLPEDCTNRVRIVDNLLKGYYQTNILTVFMNADKVEIGNLKKVLLQNEMKTMSTLNYKFGEITVNKEVLLRDIKETIRMALKTDYLPHVLGLSALGLSYVAGLSTIQDSVLALIAGAGATKLSKINLKDYIPPIQEPPSVFSLVNNTGTMSFSSQRFNDEIQLIIPPRH